MLGISVVVVSYNSEALIEATLDCLFKQNNPININWEVILVNNNSTDKTAEIAQSTAQKHQFQNFKIVLENKPGTAFARHKGISEAKYDIICFVDDDNRVMQNWITTAFNLMQNTEIGILGCAGEAEFEKAPPIWFEKEKLAYAVGSLYPNHELIDTTFDANLPTAGMCIRKRIFTDLNSKNWQPLLSGRIGNSQAPGEDTELCQAARLLGYKTYYTNQLTFKHYLPDSRLNWQRFLQMTHGFGITDVFLLPYKLVYEKNNFNTNLAYYLRKNWWVNYLGKCVVTQKNKLKYWFKLIDIQSFEKIKARNAGFCETILAEKDKFNKAFSHVESLKKSII